MLRYFYTLICLLICIEWSFCYEFIKEGGSNHLKVGKYKLRHSKERARRAKRHDNSRQDPEAHIDLANFIQQPDFVYDLVGDDESYDNKYKREKSSNDYSEYDSLSEPLQPNDLNENSNNLGSALNLYSGQIPSLIPKNSYSDTFSENNPNEKIDETNPLHKAEKKCSLQRMKFPFFSHKKVATPKTKKNKKRKLFNFRHPSKSTLVTTSLPKLSDANPSSKNLPSPSKYNKRTATERYCPLCKRKIASKVKKKKNKKSSHKLIHNSRQYFQEANDFLSKEKKELPKYNLDVRVNDNICYNEDASSKIHSRRHTKDRRRKRNQDYERERQLKELEEVQKKIDNIETTAPSHQRNNN